MRSIPLFALTLALTGCHAVRLKQHAHPGDDAALKVRPYTRIADGSKVTVPDLEVVVAAAQPAAVASRRGQTACDRHLLFADLPAGDYFVRVYRDDRLLCIRPVQLLTGQRLTLRIDIEALQLYGPYTIGESFSAHLGRGQLPEGWDASLQDLAVLRERVLCVGDGGGPHVRPSFNVGLRQVLEARKQRWRSGWGCDDDDDDDHYLTFDLGPLWD